MRSILNPIIFVAIFILATPVFSQVSFSPSKSEDIRFRWAVPESTLENGTGDVLFQLNASDKYAWVGLGIGSGMKGAEMFLVYQDGKGNVTLSTRAGEYHVMPEHTERSNVDLLEGSGVLDNRMVANIRYRGCESLDLEGKNSWIAAWFLGKSLASSSLMRTIEFHGENSMTVFEVDFSRAGVSSDQNPFLGSSDSDDGAVTEEDISTNDPILLAHGIIMTTVFVALYPLGALLMPVFGKWFLHSTSQLTAYLLMWAGFALGVTYANQIDFLGKQAHTRLGILVVSLMGFQPLLGWLHHARYADKTSALIRDFHVWYGRALMILGIVNGGLGLKFARQKSSAWVIAYSVVAGVLGATYAISMIYTITQRRRRRKARKARRNVPDGQPDPSLLPDIPLQNQPLVRNTSPTKERLWSPDDLLSPRRVS